MKRWILLAPAGLLFAGALLALGAALPAQAGGQPAPAAQEGTPAPEGQPITSSEQCLECHAAPDQIMELAGGEELYLTIDAAGVTASAHGEEDVACQDCHTDITEYPHRPLEAGTLREVAAQFSANCQECHVEEAERQQVSVHALARAEGNTDAAVCSDCHNPHYQPRVEPRSQIVATCARCHSGIAQDYRQSIHGAALAATENADVPLCVDCHGVHTIEDPQTMEFLNESPMLCARCHADPARMDRYGLNTNVLDTYVSDFHGTTATLFQKQTPDQAPNTPLCIDCHGIHNIKRTEDPQSAVLQANLLATCQQCHPGASENFPAAWLSHYTPSPTRNALVYYVNLFYTLFIPAVIGGMAVFVATDIWRLVSRRIGRGAAGGHR
jgi:nitrate/TMAO reductase-like tetraheme cytochrome c subunit